MVKKFAQLTQKWHTQTAMNAGSQQSFRHGTLSTCKMVGMLSAM